MSLLSHADTVAQEILIGQVSAWLDHTVIQLNLCPFASKPRKENLIRFSISFSETEEGLLEDLQTELNRLDATPSQSLETTLVLIPNQLNDFFDYQQFISWANAMLKREGWQGVFQFATFHPQYCFAGAEPSDAENLTNRSPVPIIHIIREASLAKAIEYYEAVEQIPERNKLRMETLTLEQKRILFPYLSDELKN